ncbi:MAG: MobB mobilization protein [Candidatus Competibacteraceae bacterium]|jgi:hypothetical protein|nr:MobB mobilization protein [Candidatus Competibacteraceae bacterium]
MPFTVLGTEALTEKIAVRVTPNEKARFNEQARVAGLSVSALIRRWCLGRKVAADVDLEMLRELRRIGGLVKHIFNESSGSYDIQTAAILDELRAAIGRVGRDRKKGQ